MATFVLFIRRDPNELREYWTGAYGPFGSASEIAGILRYHGYEFVGDDSPYYMLWRHASNPSRWAKVAHELTPPDKMTKMLARE
jgi:hypothetical protein